MAVDLSQFHQVFIEESIEGLDVMESALMALDPDDIDAESINEIFRAAHSIKGGSATFGFSDIAEFTHVLEALLDEVRDGKRGLSTEDVNLILSSVDCLREMVDLTREQKASRTELSQEIQAKLEAVLKGETAEALGSDAENINASTEVEKPSNGCWTIKFVPGHEILRTGNDPLRILKALGSLGTLGEVTVAQHLPDFAHFDPELVYLEWQLQLQTDEPYEAIEEVFEWVIDDSKLSITSASTDTSSPAPAAEGNGWIVEFAPHSVLLLSGNDPVKLFDHLRTLTTVTRVEAHSAALPTLEHLNPENLHIKWTLELGGDIDEAAIRTTFEWVEDLCELSIKPLQPDQAESPQADNLAEAKPTPVAVEKKKSVASTPSADRSAKNQTEAKSIRVGIDKIDSLINMVGELVITQSMLGQLGSNFDMDQVPKLMEGLSQLEQNTRELQENVMRIRMLPMSFAFSRFPRMVRDLSQKLGKNIHLELMGEQTELDKTVMEKIGDPLVHLVRNAVDHGIEMPDDRLAQGKPEQGSIILNSYHQGGNAIIEISDDGKGLHRDKILEKAIERGLVSAEECDLMSDEQVFDLIFQPGFSTAKEVSDVSGRGVGMDVVKRNIQSLNGVIEVHSKPGEGSKVLIRLPLTLAILDGQLVRVGENTYVFPLVSIVESIQCRKELINEIAGGSHVFKLREDFVPIVELDKVFATQADYKELDSALMVVVEADGGKIGIVVDELLSQQQVVIKSLEQNYKRIDGVSGATILGNGTVALIIDIPGIARLVNSKQNVTSLESYLKEQQKKKIA